MIADTMTVNMNDGSTNKELMNDIQLIKDTARNSWVWVNRLRQDVSPDFESRSAAENWYNDISLLFAKKAKTGSAFNPKIARLLQPMV
jgi:hypothetical protein